MGRYSHFRSMWWMALVAILCAGPGSAWADGTGAWVATQASGSVSESGADGHWQSVVAGSTLTDGAHVKTGPDGKLVLSHRQDTVTASPNSEFELPRDGEAGVGPSVLETLGTLLFRIEHTPQRRFEVDAPYLAAVVKGTVFTVSVGADGNAVHVAEGAVEVTTRLGKEVALIRPGQTAVVSPSGRDMSIMGGQGRGETPRRSESDDRGGQREARKSAFAITRTLGEEHLDVPAASKGLLESGGPVPGRKRVAATASGGSDAAGQASVDGADRGGGSSGNASAEANTSAGGNDNGAGGGNPNAAGGNPNAAGGNPNAASGNPNAAGGNPNAAGGNANAAAGQAIAAANKAKSHGKH